MTLEDFNNELMQARIHLKDSEFVQRDARKEMIKDFFFAGGFFLCFYILFIILDAFVN